MRRPLATTAVCVLAIGTLTACSPAREPIVALAVRDGAPTAVLVTCGQDFSQISVFERDPGTPTATSAQGWPTGTPTVNQLVSWRVYGHATAEVVEAELLGSPPPGWAVDQPTAVIGLPTPGAFEVVPPARLRQGINYGLSGSSHRQAVTVDFTTADFGRIGPGEVLASRDGVSTLMPRAEFEENGRETCDS